MVRGIVDYCILRTGKLLLVNRAGKDLFSESPLRTSCGLENQLKEVSGHSSVAQLEIRNS